MSLLEIFRRNPFYYVPAALIWGATTYSFFSSKPQVITVEPETQELSSVVTDTITIADGITYKLH